jgi:hypothetical protein
MRLVSGEQLNPSEDVMRRTILREVNERVRHAHVDLLDEIGTGSFQRAIRRRGL